MKKDEKKNKEEIIKEMIKEKLEGKSMSFHTKVFTNILGNENNLGILRNWMSHIFDEEINEISYDCSMSYDVVGQKEVIVHALFTVDEGPRHVAFIFGNEKEEDVKDFYLKDDEGNILTTFFRVRYFNMDKIMGYWEKKDKEKIEKFKYILMLNLPYDEIKALDPDDELIDRFSCEVKRLETSKTHKMNTCDIIMKESNVENK